jgi:acyl carrier protein
MEGNMKYTRETIKEVVFNNVERGAVYILPPCIPMRGYGGWGCENPSESLRLIEDLEMDSTDIYELIYDSCSKLGIEDEKLDFNSIHLNTIGDVIDVIWKAETK